MAENEKYSFELILNFIHRNNDQKARLDAHKGLTN